MDFIMTFFSLFSMLGAGLLYCWVAFSSIQWAEVNWGTNGAVSAIVLNLIVFCVLITTFFSLTA